MPAKATEPAPATKLALATDARRAIEMRAAVLREPGRPVAVETVLLEPPLRGEILVRVAAAGVCHSDLHLADGLLGAGRRPIVARPRGGPVSCRPLGDDVTGVAIGDHVVFCFVAPCRRCDACRCAPIARWPS